jgi:hypothetical protein
MEVIAARSERRVNYPAGLSHRRGQVLAGATAAAALAAAATMAVGRVTLERRLTREVDALFAARSGAPPAIITDAALADLPEPVRRWLRYSQVVGTACPGAVRLKQVGQFRLAEDKGWMPYTAAQYYTTDPPGYIWIARFQMAPLLSVTGRDRYMDGEGSIDMRLLSLVPVANKRGGGLNQGALLRYLNETMWFPAAACSRYITWDEVDGASARATMSYAGVTASATFMFDEQGRLTNMMAQRYNDARNALEIWSTPIQAYGEFEGVRVPIGGEGVWHYAGGNFPYIRLRITNIEYNQPARY